MRILIYGAGVIGSLYAALFAEAGYDTNIYARGKRLEALRNNGLQYKKNQEVIKAEVRILGELPNDEIYDFVFIIFEILLMLMSIIFTALGMHFIISQLLSDYPVCLSL